MSGVTDPTSPYYGYVQPTGIIVADDATLLADVQGEWTDTFGTGLSLDSSTPQGAMIASETLARSGVLQTIAVVANQINPNVAGGLFLDAICALLGLTRSAETSTIVPNVLLAGVPGSPIVAGVIATTPLVAGVGGDQFALQADVTLDATGQATGTFIAVQPGPVPAPAGGWNVLTDVLGWETVSNPQVAVPGTIQQQDEALRALRNVTLAGQGSGFCEAVRSEVGDLPGVLAVRSLENVTNGTVIIDGVTLVAHSVWYCVDGGVPASIALGLLIAKGGGANWNGAQSVPTVEPISGQTYSVLYDVPTLVPLLVRVTCKQGTFVGDLASQVVAAVAAFGANTIDGVAGFTVSDDASPFEIANGIMEYCPGIKISKVEIATVAAPIYGTVDIPMMIYQKPTIPAGNVSVVVTT